MTLHYQYELISEGTSYSVPTTENPWRKMSFNGGDIETPGAFPNWSPSIYYSVDSSWSVSVNAVYISGTGGGSTGQGLYVNPPPTTVPALYYGVVYDRPSLIRIPFYYDQYSKSGQVIAGYDSQGNELPFSSFVDRSRGGLGTYDVDTKIFLFSSGQTFPPTINHD